MRADKFKNILLVLMALLNIILLGFWWINRPGENKTSSERSSVSAPSKDDILKLVSDKLRFDSSQKSSLSTELSRHFTWMNTYHSKENADRKILMENFTQSQPDSLLGSRYGDSLGILHSQMANEMFRHFDFIRRLCKPFQLPYFQSFMRNLADSANHFENHKKGKSSFVIPENKNPGRLTCTHLYSSIIFLRQNPINN